MKIIILSLMLLLSGCACTFEKCPTLSGKWEKVNPKPVIEGCVINCSHIKEAKELREDRLI